MRDLKAPCFLGTHGLLNSLAACPFQNEDKLFLPYSEHTRVCDERRCYVAQTITLQNTLVWCLLYAQTLAVTTRLCMSVELPSSPTTLPHPLKSWHSSTLLDHPGVRLDVLRIDQRPSRCGVECLFNHPCPFVREKRHDDEYLGCG